MATRTRARSGNPRRTALIVGAAVVVLLAGAGVAKYFAEQAADTAVEERVAELDALLGGAEPEQFLALGTKLKDPGSLAARVAEQPDYLDRTRAEAARTRVFFEPGGWWSGFTERCIVAVVEADGVRFDTPKTACIRVT